MTFFCYMSDLFKVYRMILHNALNFEKVNTIINKYKTSSSRSSSFSNHFCDIFQRNTWIVVSSKHLDKSGFDKVVKSGKLLLTFVYYFRYPIQDANNLFLLFIV